jgi:hypothetical protein
MIISGITVQDKKKPITKININLTTNSNTKLLTK